MRWRAAHRKARRRAARLVAERKAIRAWDGPDFGPSPLRDMYSLWRAMKDASERFRASSQYLVSEGEARALAETHARMTYAGAKADRIIVNDIS